MKKELNLKNLKDIKTLNQNKNKRMIINWFKIFQKMRINAQILQLHKEIKLVKKSLRNKINKIKNWFKFNYLNGGEL